MEETPNTYQYLFYGYSAIWFFLMLLVFSCIRRQGKLIQEIEELKTQK